MQYRSPIPLLLQTGVNPRTISPDDLGRIRKELLIEIELSNEKVVSSGNHQYTKDDVIRIIEEVKQPKVLTFHLWIYQNPTLLGVLENHTFEEKDRAFDMSLSFHYDFSEFKAFVSPYLAPVLARMLNNEFLKHEFRTVQSLFVYQHLLSGNFVDEAFGKLRGSLKAVTNEIRSLTGNTGNFKASNFNYLSLAWVDFMNALPDPLVHFRDELVTVFINLSVAVQKKELLFCYKLSELLKLVKCSEELKRIVLQNLKVFAKANRYGKVVEEPEKVIAKRRGCFVIAIVFIVAVIAIRTFMSGHSSDKEIERVAPTRSQLSSALLKNSLRDVTQVQLHPVEASLEQAWATDSVPYKIPEWPYPEIAEYLVTRDTYFSEENLTFKNESEYDVVIVMFTEDELRSAIVGRGSALKAEITYSDKIWFYIGKDWDHSKWFVHEEPLRNMKILTGLFTKVDANTLSMLEQTWAYDKFSVRVKKFEVTFESPTEGSFKIKDNHHVLKRVEDLKIEVPLSTDTSSLPVLQK